MEARLLFIALAAIAAFGCAFCLAGIGAITLRRRRVASAGGAGDASWMASMVAWRLRKGVPLLSAPVSFLLKGDRMRSFMEDAVALAEQRGLATSPDALASVLAMLVVLVAVVAAAITGSIVAGVAVPLCLAAACVMAVNSVREKQSEAARNAVPDALESMSACFGSGYTLMQTLQQVADDVEGPLAVVFAQAAHVLETGGSARDALFGLRTGSHASELAFVAVALDVQHQSGGAMKQVLDAATDTVKGELALRRSLRVQTAQARFSARVVAVMPLVLIAAFSLISPDFLKPFFESALGYVLLGVAIAMQLAGVVLVRKALSVEGVS